MREEAGTSTLDGRDQDRLWQARAERKRHDAPTAAPAAPRRPHIRLWHGLRRPANWLQLLRFAIVGAIGYAVNLAVLAVCVHPLSIEYHLAAALAWVIAGANNFMLNRHWTFDAGDGHFHGQAARFLLITLVALGVNELALTILKEEAGLTPVFAQIPALALAMPVNFLGNKFWSFSAARIPVDDPKEG